MGVRFRLLGPVEAIVDDTMLPIPSGKLSVVLAGLLLRANHTVPVDQLVRWLWDREDPDPHRAKATVQEYVRRLRRTLGSADAIRTMPGGYLINAHDDSLDVLRFRTLAARGRSAAEAGELGAAAERLTAALGLWRGPALSNIHSRALHDDEITHLTEQRLLVSERWAETMLGIGKHERLIPDLRKLTKEHPLRERLWEHLILALYRDHRQAEALAAYSDIRTALTNELGVDPGPALRQLHQAILTNDSSLDARPGPSRQGSTREPPRQLPADINHFTGRTNDLNLLTQLASTQSGNTTAVAVIEGTAGVGKTALAVHFSHLVAKKFPDGQFYINLRGYGPGDPVAPAAALAALLGAFGTSSDQLPADLDARAALWRTNTFAKQVLVLLDNARDTQQIRPLLASSGCLTLVTSRTQLRGLVARDGARRIVLDRLDTHEALSLLTSIVGVDRVTAELADARRIVEVCARLPLAIRILGERVSRYPDAQLAEVAEHIDSEHDRLAIFDLEDDEDTNLSAILTHSYRTLDTDSARLFRLLGSQPVLDFTAPSAGAIAEISNHQARALLERLAAAHLLEQRRPNRYQFHDLMRDFASSLARAQDGDRLIKQATRRLLDWYLHTVVAGDRQLNPDRISGPQYPLPADIRPVELTTFRDALTWFDSERANLVTISRLAPQRGADRQVAWFARELFNYQVRRGDHTDDLVAICGMSLAASRRLESRIGEAFSLNGLGVAYSRLNQPIDAISCFTGALDIWRDIGDHFRQRQIITNPSTAYERNGQYHEAIAYGMESLSIARALSNAKLVAISLVTLAVAYLKAAQYKQAIACAQDAIELDGGAEKSYIEGAAFRTLGSAHAHQSDYEQGFANYQRSLRAFRRLDMSFEESETLVELGDAHSQGGDTSTARRCWQRALATLVEMRHPLADEVLDRLAGLDDTTLPA